VKGWKKIYQASRTQKQAGVAIFIIDKACFKQKSEEIKSLQSNKRTHPYSKYLCTKTGMPKVIKKNTSEDR
jgi:hypothetical protein